MYIHQLFYNNLINASCRWEPSFSDFQEQQNSESYHDERKAQVGRKKAKLHKVPQLLDSALEQIN